MQCLGVCMYVCFGLLARMCLRTWPQAGTTHRLVTNLDWTWIGLDWIGLDWQTVVAGNGGGNGLTSSCEVAVSLSPAPLPITSVDGKTLSTHNNKWVCVSEPHTHTQLPAKKCKCGFFCVPYSTLSPLNQTPFGFQSASASASSWSRRRLYSLEG